jgi:trafficking protein particle complex subunit 11
MPPPEDAPYAQTHSPLSPLTPSSPLHPDGLIAPIWIRKHTTLVPAVFVLFTRLFEYVSQTPRSPLDPQYDPAREAEERQRDSVLAQEIAERKRSTSERNIKLTVVLIASRRMLDDPALDARLTYIRRTSGLDSKAALFVLSPVSPAELEEFVKRYGLATA